MNNWCGGGQVQGGPALWNLQPYVVDIIESYCNYIKFGLLLRVVMYGTVRSLLLVGP